MAESNEYGYESLIKATFQVLEKLNLENKTLTEITPKARKEQRLWNAVALREAVINAFVHNAIHGRSHQSLRFSMID